MIAIAIVYYRLPVTRQEARLLVKKTFVVMVCFLLSVIIVVIALSIRMITAKTSLYQHFAIWFSVGITYPISLLFFPVGYLLCFYPVSKNCRYLELGSVSASSVINRRPKRNVSYDFKSQPILLTLHQHFKSLLACPLLVARSSKCRILITSLTSPLRMHH